MATQPPLHSKKSWADMVEAADRGEDSDGDDDIFKRLMAVAEKSKAKPGASEGPGAVRRAASCPEARPAPQASAPARVAPQAGGISWSQLTAGVTPPKVGLKSDSFDRLRLLDDGNTRLAPVADEDEEMLDRDAAAAAGSEEPNRAPDLQIDSSRCGLPQQLLQQKLFGDDRAEEEGEKKTETALDTAATAAVEVMEEEEDDEGHEEADEQEVAASPRSPDAPRPFPAESNKRPREPEANRWKSAPGALAAQLAHRTPAGDLATTSFGGSQAGAPPGADGAQAAATAGATGLDGQAVQADDEPATPPAQGGENENGGDVASSSDAGRSPRKRLRVRAQLTEEERGPAPSVPLEERDLPPSTRIEPPQPLTPRRRLSQRLKQIALGKSTDGYRLYIEQVPRSERVVRRDPQTPDATQECSKRSWDGQVRRWRRMLHAFDPAAEPNAAGWSDN